MCLSHMRRVAIGSMAHLVSSLGFSRRAETVGNGCSLATRMPWKGCPSCAGKLHPRAACLPMGCSWAKWFAQQLSEQVLHGSA